METNTINPKFKTNIERLKWKYILKRSAEIAENGLTCRIVIDFQKGCLNMIQNQETIAGITSVVYNLNN